MVWHGEALRRMDRLPDLDELAGSPPRAPAGAAERMRHNLRLWKAALAARTEAEA